MENLANLFAQITAWHWLAAAVLLVIVEMLLGTSFFMLWLGASAAAIALIMWIYPSLLWEAQFLIFAAVSAISLLYWYWHLKKSKQATEPNNLNRRNEQYVGRTVTIDEPIVNGRGKIHIDDSFWRIEGPDMPAGTQIKIIGVDGVVLKVAKHTD